MPHFLAYPGKVVVDEGIQGEGVKLRTSGCAGEVQAGVQSKVFLGARGSPCIC
jgi:hypothetical protein